MNKPETHAAPADSAVVANGKGLVNHKTQGIHVAPAVLSAATTNEGELLSSLLTVPGGLTQTEAEDRLRSSGPERSGAAAPSRLAPPAFEDRPQSAGHPARNLVGDLLCDRRFTRRNSDGRHGRAQRCSPLLAGSPGGCRRRQAQGHDPRNRHRAFAMDARRRCRSAISCPATSSSSPRAT